MESASGPPAARIIGKVNGENRTRAIATFNATYVTANPYKVHPNHSRRTKRSRSARPNAAATSCHRYAIGVHTENGKGVPGRDSNRATTKTPKKLRDRIAERDSISSVAKERPPHFHSASPKSNRV